MKAKFCLVHYLPFEKYFEICAWLYVSLSVFYCGLEITPPACANFVNKA